MIRGQINLRAEAWEEGSGGPWIWYSKYNMKVVTSGL
jgi:hypothetical protein